MEHSLASLIYPWVILVAGGAARRSLPRFLAVEVSKPGGHENGVQDARFSRGLLGLENAVVEGVEFDEDEGTLVASVRPWKGKRNRCGLCHKRSPEYDKHSGRRR